MKLFEIQRSIEWRDIKGWPYQISSNGLVRNLKGKILKTWEHLQPGDVVYERVTLKDRGRRVNARVHRLVAQAFIPNPDNLPEVDHIDRNSVNNTVGNLRWSTFTDNQNNRQRHWLPHLDSN